MKRLRPPERAHGAAGKDDVHDSAASDRCLIRLRGLTFERVDFDVFDKAGLLRSAVVHVGSGDNWDQCSTFPNVRQGEAGLTTGDPVLDEEIRLRAGDALALLANIVREALA